MRSARLSLALETGALTLPATGQIAVYRPRIGDDLSDLPKGQIVVLTGFKPDHDHFAQRYAVNPVPALCGGPCLPAEVARSRAGADRAGGGRGGAGRRDRD